MLAYIYVILGCIRKSESLCALQKTFAALSVDESTFQQRE